MFKLEFMARQYRGCAAVSALYLAVSSLIPFYDGVKVKITKISDGKYH